MSDRTKRTNTLKQYIDLMAEIEETKKRIEKLQIKLDKINEGGNVKDAVKGGDGGLQTFHIEGFPTAEEDETKYLLQKRIRILNERQARAREMVVEVEQYINTIDDVRMRRMITYRYINGYSWRKTAICMGKMYTEESCRKQMKRFFDNK